MPRMKQLKQRGDTIVEVLICLAIVGAALTISYGTARRSLFRIEDAHERGEMLAIAQTQLERLKNKLANDATFDDTVSGFEPDGTVTEAGKNKRLFCLTAAGGRGLAFDGTGIGDPADTRCAVNKEGKFYVDDTSISPHEICGSENTTCQANVNNAGYVYRVGVVYRPEYSSGGNKGDDPVNEWYVVAGRFAAGGYGNAQEFSIVPLMYRQTP